MRYNLNSSYLIMALWLCCHAAFSQSPTHAKPSRPNYVIIMADDMGYSTASAYDGWIKTPALEQMPQKGQRQRGLPFPL